MGSDSYRFYDPFNLTQQDAQQDAQQAQQDANYLNEQRMKEAEKKRQEEFNKLNQKKPNIAALLAANTKKGTGTSLTGPGGVNPASLTLGSNSLLGY